MKTSNKILLGTIGLVVFCMLSMLIFVRANLSSQDLGEDTSEWQTQIRNVDDFQEIFVHTVANVYISQGKNKFEMKGTENMLASVEVLVEDGKLIVRDKDGVSSKSRSGGLVLYVTTDSLVNVLHSGVGSIESSTALNFPDLKINTSGANDASLEINCNSFRYHQTGVGSVNITGTAESVSYSNTGAGNMDGSDFTAKTVDVHGTGIGSFYVHATEQLNINLTGAGSVSYKGNPRIQQNISGIGSVSAM